MIITCEKCETKFSFDETRLGIGGRKLRCANCKHVWHVSPPELEMVEKVEKKEEEKKEIKVHRTVKIEDALSHVREVIKRIKNLI